MVLIKKFICNGKLGVNTPFIIIKNPSIFFDNDTSSFNNYRVSNNLLKLFMPAQITHKGFCNSWIIVYLNFTIYLQ